MATTAPEPELQLLRPAPNPGLGLQLPETFAGMESRPARAAWYPGQLPTLQ